VVSASVSLSDATNSFTVLALTEAFTTMTRGVMVKREMGRARSEAAAGIGFERVADRVVDDREEQRVPSAPDRTVSRAAISRSRRAGVSTITGWRTTPRGAPDLARARSGELPGGEDTRMRIGFEGRTARRRPREGGEDAGEDGLLMEASAASVEF